jgi:hypothetical protein
MAERLRPVVDLFAQCACGAVSISVTGPIKAMFMCSCEDCQKATGTGHSTVAVAEQASVEVTGEVRAYERPSASGAAFTRHFCPKCGTPLHGFSSRASRLVSLPIGLFGADADWYAPNQLIFARSHREWDIIAEGLPRYETYRESVHVRSG